MNVPWLSPWRTTRLELVACNHSKVDDSVGVLELFEGEYDDREHVVKSHFRSKSAVTNSIEALTGSFSLLLAV